MSEGQTCVLILVALVLICFAGEVGRSDGTNTQKRLAVEAGVAEYSVDPKTGETTFVYKTCK